MIGAIAGDIIGSIYEKRPIKTKEFPLFQKYSKFTDDTVMTIAVADCMMNGKDYEATLKSYGQKYPKRGYGGYFTQWFLGLKTGPYNSFGNGSAMRVSSIGFLLNDETSVLAEAQKSAEITHNHPEGIKGAQAIALSILMARQGKSKDEIAQVITNRFDYDLSRKLDKIRESYEFNVTCQGSVPEAIISFIESENYEDAIRNAISLGGDSDTLACMVGGIAEAYYGEIPVEIISESKKRLKADLLSVLAQYEANKMLNTGL